MQLVAPAAEYRSPEQSLHWARPAAEANLPASHGSQEAWPVDPWADPAVHAVQLEEPSLEAMYPAEQDWHTIVDSVGVKRPMGQALQLVAPVST